MGGNKNTKRNKTEQQQQPKQTNVYKQTNDKHNKIKNKHTKY